MILENIAKLHIEDIKNEKHPSILFETDEYKVLILRLFKIENNLVNSFSLSYIVDDKNQVFFYDRLKDNLILQTKKEFYNQIDKAIDTSMHDVKLLIEEVDTLEESILDNKDVMIEWFNLKKSFSKIERIINQVTNLKEDFLINLLEIDDNQMLSNYFNDIEEHLNRIHKISQAANSKLETIYNLNSALKNEKLNSVMYILTVISAIFLPLNLIVGFFGMNTEGLFFSGNADGTDIVVKILLAIFIILLLIFIKREWLNL
jgi:magnesium transporter